MRRILPIFGCLVVVAAVLLLAPAGGEDFTPYIGAATDAPGAPALPLVPDEREEGDPGGEALDAPDETGDTGADEGDAAAPGPSGETAAPGADSGPDAGRDSGKTSGDANENGGQDASGEAPGGQSGDNDGEAPGQSDENGGKAPGQDGENGDENGTGPGGDSGVPSQGGDEDGESAPCPELMAQRLSEAGFELDDIAGSQLIVVKSSGSSARISAFEANGGVWTVFLEESAGHVGRNGVSASKTEGDGKTPMGIFPLPGAFGNEPDPGCLLPYRQATANSYWVDDPGSASYNMWVEDDGNRDWQSAEHISELTTAYAYAAVVGYNTDPITPGAGSAIFLHVGSGPTAGCVSTSRENVVKLLRWLDPQREPRILIF